MTKKQERVAELLGVFVGTVLGWVIVFTIFGFTFKMICGG